MSYLVGLDLGQAQDYTALAVVEQVGGAPTVLDLSGSAYRRPDPRQRQERHWEPARYHVRHLERFRLGTPYPDVVKRVQGLCAAPSLGDYELIVDATGVGAPVVDLLSEAGLAPIAVTITAGNAVTYEDGGYRVPKRDLVSTLQVLLQTERLKVAEGLPEAATLVREMLAFEVKITDTAHDMYGAWREGAHDDLVLAVALACWYGERDKGGPLVTIMEY